MRSLSASRPRLPRTAQDLDTKSVSGTHARINIHPTKHVAQLTDLGSTNGTFVDALRLTDASAPLAHGSTVRFGYDKEVFM